MVRYICAAGKNPIWPSLHVWLRGNYAGGVGDSSERKVARLMKAAGHGFPCATSAWVRGVNRVQSKGETKNERKEYSGMKAHHALTITRARAKKYECQKTHSAEVRAVAWPITDRSW